MSTTPVNTLVPVYIPTEVQQPQNTSDPLNLQPVYTKTVVREPQTESTEPKTIEAKIITNEEINAFINQNYFEEAEYSNTMDSIIFAVGGAILVAAVVTAIVVNPLFALGAILGGAVIGYALYRSATSENSMSFVIQNRGQFQDYIQSSPERARVFKNGNESTKDALIEGFQREFKLQGLITQKNALEKSRKGQAMVLDQVLNHQPSLDEVKIDQHLNKQERNDKIEKQIGSQIQKQQTINDLFDKQVENASEGFELQQRILELAQKDVEFAVKLNKLNNES